MALIVSVSVAGAAELTPDTGIDTPVDKVDPMRNCLCDDGRSVACLTGQVCDPVACVCGGIFPDEPIYECSLYNCTNGTWTKCAVGGNYYRELNQCLNNRCMNIGEGYSCPTGTYGSPTSCNDTCTVCPTNATCDLGLNTTYWCDEGYYDAAGLGRKECLPCPADGNTTCDFGRFSCKSGYYRTIVRVRPTFGDLWGVVQEYRCEKCPNEATTSGRGATSKTECYLPENTSETPTYKDSYGKFKVSGDCFWTQ